MAAKTSARDVLMVVVVGVLLLGGLVLTVVGAKYKPYSIPAGSMIPALLPGDKVMVDRTAYADGAKPARGDVVVFLFPKDESINYVKRVVGLPGDEVEIRDKVLYVNDREVKIRRLEDATWSELLENEDDRRVLTAFEEDLEGHRHVVFYNMSTLLNADYAPRRIPEGQYLVLGDNRDKSSDSRFWGFVPGENIVGRVSFVYWSSNSDRIGDVVR